MNGWDGGAAALIVAAGSGSRLGGAPKQHRAVAGRPMLHWSVQRFLGAPGIDRVLVVIAPGAQAAYRESLGPLLGAPALLPPVEGGSSRQASVRAGLEAIAGTMSPRWVLIHDAARPAVGAALVARVLSALPDRPAVVPALPVTDTLRRFAAGRAVEEVARDGLLRMQTPQGFDFALLLDAHRRGPDGATDDAALMVAAGHPVGAVEGDSDNVKVTTIDDLATVERHLRGPEAARRWKTGSGFDVHRLVPGRRLVLLGLEIPHDRGLDGHSDADVALHAVTDAILGALGAGDIGQHFPPSEARWRDAPSALFARHAAGLAAAAGASIEHVDVTIIGERPKIGPHRERLRASLAAILGIAVADTAVKATTTERLGFAGRGEGLAAQALATLSFGRGAGLVEDRP